MTYVLIIYIYGAQKAETVLSAVSYIYIYVDIFIIVFYPPYHCNIRYVVLSFDEIKTHYKSLDLNELKADMARAPWHITGALEDIDDS